MRQTNGVVVETRTAPVGAQEEDDTVLAATFNPVYSLIARYYAAMHAREYNSESLLDARAATG